MRSHWKIGNSHLTKAIAVIMLSLLIQSCSFESTDVYESDLEEPLGEIPVVELDLNDSVLYVDQKALLEYSVNFDLQEVLLVEFIMDENLYKSLESGEGSVLIESTPGEHQLEMVIYTTTESGSIADKIGREAFVYSNSWVLYVGDNYSEPIQIQSISETENQLEIEWEPFDGYGFHSYELYKTNASGQVLLFTTEDQDRISYFEQCYIGGESSYFIRLNLWRLSPKDGDPYGIKLPDYHMNMELEESSSIRLTWSRCRPAANFGSYLLYRESSYGTRTILLESFNVDDTTTLVSVNPEQEYLFKLEYRSGEDSPCSELIQKEKKYVPGMTVSPEFEHVTQTFYHPYRVHTPSFTYNPDSDEIIPHQFPESRGVFAVTAQNRYLLCGNKLYDDPGFTREMKILKNLPAEIFDHPGTRVSTSSNLSLTYLETKDTGYFYSLWGDKSFNRIPVGSSFSQGKISPDGKYFMCNSRAHNCLYMYRISNIGGQLMAMADVPYCSAEPIFLSEETFATMVGDNIEIWSYEDYEMLKSVECDALKLVAYDPISHTLLAADTRHLFVYDASELNLLASRNIGNYYPLSHGKVAYLNKTVFLCGSTPGNSIILKLSF